MNVIFMSNQIGVRDRVKLKIVSDIMSDNDVKTNLRVTSKALLFLQS